MPPVLPSRSRTTHLPPPLGEPSDLVKGRGVSGKLGRSGKGGYAASTALPTSYHPLASPYGRGGRPNGLTERVPTLFLLQSVPQMRCAATLSVTGLSSPVPALPEGEPSDLVEGRGISGRSDRFPKKRAKGVDEMQERWAQKYRGLSPGIFRFYNKCWGQAMSLAPKL